MILLQDLSITSLGVAIDPICGMPVEQEKAISAEWNGQTHYFCAKGCREEFLADPHQFLKAAWPGDLSLDNPRQILAHPGRLQSHIATAQSKPLWLCSTARSNPAAAPSRTSQVELILKRKSSSAATRANAIVNGSTLAVCPNCHVAAVIRASEATLTPSSRPLAQREFRKCGMKGLLTAPRKN